MSHINSSEKKKALNVLRDLNYVYVDWNCLNHDSEKIFSNEQLLNNLKKNSKNKGTLIILMHDTTDVNKSYSVLKESIDYLKSEGYRFSNFYDFFNKWNPYIQFVAFYFLFCYCFRIKYLIFVTCWLIIFIFYNLGKLLLNSYVKVL